MLEGSLLAKDAGQAVPSWDVVQSHVKSFCDHEVSRNTTLCEESIALAKIVNPSYVLGREYDGVIPLKELAGLSLLTRQPAARFSSSDLTNVYSMFDSYKKYGSPLARISPANLLKRVDSCLGGVSPKQELYGECLLQKILMMETLQTASKDIFDSVNHYFAWLKGLPTTSPGYARLREASTILERLATEKKAQTNLPVGGTSIF